MVAGDYYGIWCEGDDGKGKRERKRFPFSVPIIRRASLIADLLLTLIGESDSRLGKSQLPGSDLFAFFIILRKLS